MHRVNNNQELWGVYENGIDNTLITQEKEANYFASCLLMPKDEVTKQWKKTKSISELANFFNVSEESMWYRISNLWLLNQI